MTKESLNNQELQPEAEVLIDKEELEELMRYPQGVDDLEIDLKKPVRVRVLDEGRKVEVTQLPEYIVERRARKKAVKRNRHNATEIENKRLRKGREAKLRSLVLNS